jgi:phage terminase small subunit
MKDLTPQQERFARNVVSGMTQADAYRDAYPKSKAWKATTVHENASRLGANRKVCARIAELAEKVTEKAVITKADVLKEASRLATFDIRRLYKEDGGLKAIHELDDETAAAIQGIEQVEQYEGSGKDRVFVGYLHKYKICDKNAALEKLFKHFGLYEKDNEQKNSPLAGLLSLLGGNVVGPVTETAANAGQDDDGDD